LKEGLQLNEERIDQKIDSIILGREELVFKIDSVLIDSDITLLK
jgi:hypothetical protein